MKTPLSKIEVFGGVELISQWEPATRYWIVNKDAKRAVRVMVGKSHLSINNIDMEDLPGDYTENGPAYMGDSHSDILNIVRRMI